MGKTLTPAQQFEMIAADAGEDFEKAEPRLRGSVGRLVMHAGYEALYAKLRHADRVRLKAAPRITRQFHNTAWAKRATANLLETWRLRGGVPLAQANKAMLREEADWEDRASEGHRQNKVWYLALEQMLPNEQAIVGEAIGPAQAQKARDAAGWEQRDT